MKPNFALILSMEGIALLQRSSPGWSLVGDAYPDNPDIASEMAALRNAAERLSPGTATFKVVIPNDQIRYLSIPAGSPDPDTRRREVEAALDGATPYALDELAIDYAISGDKLQIAAVALETLQEADEFARGFGFDPMSFVAMPEGNEYSGEPFFGTAHDVPDHVEVTPDTTAIRVAGRVRIPDEGEPSSGLSTVTDAADEPAEATTSNTGSDSENGDEAGPVSFSSVRSRASGDDDTNTDTKTPTPDIKTAGSAKGKSDDPGRSNGPRITFAEPSEGKGPAPVVMPPRDIRPEELASTLKAEGEAETPSKPSAFAGALAAGSGVAARLRQKMSDRRAAKADAKAKAEELAKEAAAAALMPTAPVVAEGISNPAPAKTAEPATSEPEQVKPKGKGKGRKGKAAAKTATVTATAVPATNTATSEAGAALAEGDAPTPFPRASGILSAEERRAEEERLTVFGARNASYPETGGRSGTLIVAAILALFMLGTAGWAVLFRDSALAPIIGVQEPETSSDEQVADAPEDVQDSFVPPGPTDTSTAPTDQAAITEPAQDDVATVEEPAIADNNEEVSPLIVTEAATAPEQGQADQADGTSAEDEARYAASGIWQESPGELTASDGTDADTGTDSTADPDAPPDRGPDVDLAALTPDSRPAEPAPPPVFGKRYDMDDRGLVIATPDGAETPSGVMAFAGDPPVVPPTRPGDPEPTQTDADAEEQTTEQPEAEAPSDAQLTEEPQPVDTAEPAGRYAEFRPRSRPGTVSTANEDTATDTTETGQLDDVAIAAGASLAGSAVSGDGEATALIDDEDRASIAAGLASGAQAVQDAEAAEEADQEPELVPAFSALRPIKRPNNIAELAAAARVVQEPPPAVQPSGPTSVSVARQATLRNAINLREVNLIGVYGQPSDRRALVRLSNGRYRKVKVGDRVDGGRVVAIGDDTLRYQKNGRNLTLNMPSG